MKLLFVLLACVAVTVIAAPTKEEEKALEAKIIAVIKGEEKKKEAKAKDELKKANEEKKRSGQIGKVSEDNKALLDKIITVFINKKDDLKAAQAEIKDIIGEAQQKRG